MAQPVWVLDANVMAQVTPPDVRSVYDTVLALGLVGAGVALVVLAVFRIGHLRGGRTEFGFKDLVRLATDPFGLVAVIGAALIASGIVVSQRDYRDVIDAMEELNGQLRVKLEELDHDLAKGREELAEVKRHLQDAIDAVRSMSMEVVLDFGPEGGPDPRQVEVTAFVRHEHALEGATREVAAQPTGGSIVVLVTDLRPGDSVWLTAREGERIWETPAAIKVPVIAVDMEPVEESRASLAASGASAMGGAR